MKNFILLLFFAVVMSATSITLENTGVCGGANIGCPPGLLAVGALDSNWTFTGFGVTTESPSQVIAPIECTGCTPPIGYLGNDGLSEWIEPNTGASAFPAPSTWQAETMFNLTGLNPNTAVINFSVAVDNQFSVYINGMEVFDPSASCTTLGNGTTPYCFSQFYSATTGSNITFLPGVNTIQIDVLNLDNPSPTALRVELNGTASLISSTPEPTTMLFVGVGLLIIGLKYRKQSNH